MTEFTGPIPITPPPITTRKSWARDTGWLLGANLSKTGGLLAILIVLARIMDQATVGRYALALAITTPIFVFAQMGLKGIFLTHKLSFRFNTYLTVQLGTALLGTALSIGIAAATAPELVLTITLVSLIKWGDAITDLFAGPLQQYGHTARIFWGVALSSLASAAAAIVALILTSSLDFALATLALVSTVVVAIAMWIPGYSIVIRRERHSVSPSQHGPLWAIITAGAPIGAGAALLALVSSVPQYFLSATHGADAVAHFAVLFYTLAVADIFMNTLVQSWIPRAREATTNSELAPHGFFRFLLRTASTWSALFAPLALIGIVLAWVVIPIVFGPTFTLSLQVAVPIFIAVMLMPIANFSNIGVIVQNQYLHSVTLAVASAAASFLACAALVPEFAIAGAFWALTVASAARTIPSLLILKRHR